MKKFLKDSKKSREREAILRHRFIYDLSIAATKRGYYLSNYTADVDNEGADIILSDGDSTRPIQLKAVFDDGKKDEWEIHRQLLRPDIYLVEKLGFRPESFSEGIHGSFILQVIKEFGDSINISYEYADVYTLRAMEWEIVKRKYGGCKSKTLSNFMDSLVADKRNSKIKIKRSMLLTAQSPDHLLALLGFHSPIQTSGHISDQLIQWFECSEKIRRDFEEEKMMLALEVLIKDNFKKLIVEKI